MLSKNNPKIDENKSHPAKKIAPHHNRNTSESQNPRGNQNPNSDAELNPMLIHGSSIRLTINDLVRLTVKRILLLSRKKCKAEDTLRGTFGRLLGRTTEASDGRSRRLRWRTAQKILRHRRLCYHL